MGKSQKVILIVGAVMLVGGMVITLCAIAAAGFDFRNLSTVRDWNPVSQTFTADSPDSYSEIIVKDASENVRFEQSDSDIIEIQYWENEQKSYSVTDEGGVLTVQAHYKPVFNFMMIDLDDRTTVVKIPGDFEGTISAELASGNIYASDFASLSAATMSTTSGNIELKNITADLVTADDMSGGVYLTDITASEIKSNLTSGNANLKTCEADIVSIEAMSGNITVGLKGSADDYAIAASAISGNVDAPRGTVGAEKSISLHAVSGNIDLTFSESSSGNAGERAADAVRSEGRSKSSSGGTGSAPTAPEAPSAPAAPEAPRAPAAPVSETSIGVALRGDDPLPTPFAPSDHSSLLSCMVALLSRIA